MSFENRLHAVLLVACVALFCAAFTTAALDDAAQAEAVAKAKTTRVASSGTVPGASR